MDAATRPLGPGCPLPSPYWGQAARAWRHSRESGNPVWRWCWGVIARVPVHVKEKRS